MQLEQYQLQTLEHSAVTADAWLDSLTQAAAAYPGAFSDEPVLSPEQLEEARRYFFAAKHYNAWLSR